MSFNITDLERMWRFGANVLPTAGKKFVDAAKALDDTSGLDDHAFCCDYLPPSPMSAPFKDLRILLQNEVFVKSRDNLVKSGEVLAAYTIDVAETDATASGRLKDIIKEVENGPWYERPVGKVPEAPESLPRLLPPDIDN